MLRRCVLWVPALFFALVVLFAQDLNRMRAAFDRGQYERIIVSLIDYRENLGEASGSSVDEADYMLTTAMCAIPRDRADGCKYAAQLRPRLRFGRRVINTAEDFGECCTGIGLAGPCAAGVDGKADSACASSSGKSDSGEPALPRLSEIREKVRAKHRGGAMMGPARTVAPQR